MLLASEWVTADEAVASGLALRVCPEGTVLEETLALARTIASFPSHATRQIKRLMLAGRGYAVGDARRARGGGLRRPVRRSVGQSRGRTGRRPGD